ncbi:histidinol dehydrogenase [Microbacterium sp. NPDC055910]|uniref:histidinol dehydrogenase n=1 Tax=Microbacterium sp. NPDC055910 TaxID=3345659 RepID=UPI0035DB9FDC
MGFSWTRVSTWIVALAVGAVYGLAGTIAHAYVVIGIPLGVVLGLLGCGALVVAVRLLTGDRWAALATGLGMTIATLVFSGRGPGGSVIVPESALGTVWTLALPIIVVLVVAWPSRLPVAAPPIDRGAAQAN